MGQNRESLATFLEKHPNAEATGFFWRDPSTAEFCVVVLARDKRLSEAEEFRSDTAAGLIAAAASVVDLGPEVDVARRCESSPRWLVRRRPRGHKRTTDGPTKPETGGER